MNSSNHHAPVRLALRRGVQVLFIITAIVAFMPLLVSAETAITPMDARMHGVNALKNNDFDGAASHFHEAAVNGDTVAQFYLGLLCENGKGVDQDCMQAMKWYRKAAEKGLTDAQIKLGAIYGKGLGVPQDYAQAVNWWEQAAEKGDARAKFYLGMMYENGHGVPTNCLRARHLYREAAEQGIVGAQYRLGLMYYNGRGIRKDYIQAHKWFNLAAASADEEFIKERREAVEAKMEPAEIAEAQKLARIWTPETTQATSLGMTCRHNLQLLEVVN
jgi:hypothetical protein